MTAAAIDFLTSAYGNTPHMFPIDQINDRELWVVSGLCGRSEGYSNSVCDTRESMR